MENTPANAGPDHSKPSATGSVRWHWLFWFLPLPALVIYGAFLGNPLVFDDLNGPFWKLPVPSPETITPRVVAWLSFLPSSYWPETALRTLRTGNLLIHLGTVVLSFFLIRDLLNVDVSRRNEQKRNEHFLIALLGALLFSLHPVATYGTGYLIQRTILLATFFGVLATWLHLRGQLTGRPAWFAAAAIALLLALFSKEHVVMLPAFLGILSVWLSQRDYPWRRGWHWAFVIYGLSSLTIVVMVKSGVGFGAMYEPHAQINFPDIANPYLTSLSAQLILFFKYLGLWLVPLPAWLSIDLQHNLFYHALGWPALLAAVSLGALTLLALRHLKTSPLPLVWLWAITLFMTEVWAIRLAEGFVLYRSYLWMLPIPFAVAWLILRLPRRIGMAPTLTLAALLVLAYAWGSWNRLDSMSSEVKVWQDAARKNQDVTWPMASRAHSTLGAYYGKSGQLNEAYTQFQRAVELNPLHVTAWCNLTVIHQIRNQPDIARQMLARAIQASPNDPCIAQLTRQAG